MPIDALYNEYSDHYNVADMFGSISESHQCAIEQIKQAGIGQNANFKVLDLGVGDGLFLKQIKKFIPHAHCTGIDISSKMLKKASEQLALTTIESSATDASHYLPHHSQDLVLAHFINAYIPIDKLFNQAKLLTRANGYFSLISSTYESFPVAQKQVAEFITKDSIMGKIVGHYYKGLVKNNSVASGEDELYRKFAEYDFEVVRHQRLYLPIAIKNLDELARFGIEGTWFLNILSIRLLPRTFLLKRLRRLSSKIFSFPYHDTHIIDIFLAKK